MNELQHAFAATNDWPEPDPANDPDSAWDENQVQADQDRKAERWLRAQRRAKALLDAPDGLPRVQAEQPRELGAGQPEIFPGLPSRFGRADVL